MRRIALLLSILAMAACGGAIANTTTTTGEATTTTVTQTPNSSIPDQFPVTLTAANGEVEIESEPTAVISLSPSATENLFAVGAGDQVVAVDDQSNYPASAPVTDLSGFTPNLEAILSYDPDLVVITFDPGGILEGLAAVGVPVLLLPSATSLDDAYSEIEVLGAATGHLADAAQVVSNMQTEIDEIVSEIGPTLAGTSIYHELDPTYYTVSSHSYVGELYEMLGLVNIADAGDPDGFGYPQLSAEYIVSEDPDVILLADAGFGESLETLKQRPGWSEMSAVQSGSVIAVDPDLSSRWTPRSVVFMRDVGEQIAQLVPVN